MLRVLQRVAPRGWLSSVCTMMLSTLASSILRGTPGRDSSSSPSTPRSRKRRRHLPTVCTVTLSCAAHDGRNARRPDLRRQSGLRRMAPGELPGAGSPVHAGRPGEHASLHPGTDRRSAGEGIAMAIEKTDVGIVGVCAAGGILAAELGKAGRKVIGLERGPRLSTEDFTAHDQLRFFQRQDLRPNVKRQPIMWRPNANARATPLPVLNYGNQAGGGTVHYGSVSWRFHEDDFRARSHTIERYGASAIPQDSSLADWPLSYADLEPYYDRAEYELGVSGKAGNMQGNKIDGGNVFEAPRRRDYPLPPLRDDQSGVVF